MKESPFHTEIPRVRLEATIISRKLAANDSIDNTGSIDNTAITLVKEQVVLRDTDILTSVFITCVRPIVEFKTPLYGVCIYW